MTSKKTYQILHALQNVAGVANAKKIIKFMK